VNEGAKFLYCVLHDLVQGREGPTRPVTRAQLAAACGVSADTIDRRLAQLVAVGAVEKEHQIRAGGQQANVYRVWLTPPDGLRRSPANPVDNRSRRSAAPVEGAANPQVRHSRESAAPPAQPHGCGAPGRTGAAPNSEEGKNQEDPPQPPREAGGRDVPSQMAGPDPLLPAPSAPVAPDVVPSRSPLDGERTLGVSASPGTPRRLRAAGTNPRAEADRAEQARLEAEARVRRAAVERADESRRAAERAAALEADRLEAEAQAVSGALDDATLTAVVTAVRPSMSGPLASSALALSRAVVSWCRSAAQAYPDHGFADAVRAGLAARLTLEEGSGSAPLALPAASPGTPSLRARIATRRTPLGE